MSVGGVSRVRRRGIAVLLVAAAVTCELKQAVTCNVTGGKGTVTAAVFCQIQKLFLIG